METLEIGSTVFQVLAVLLVTLLALNASQMMLTVAQFAKMMDQTIISFNQLQLNAFKHVLWDIWEAFLLIFAKFLKFVPHHAQLAMFQEIQIHV